MLTITHKTFLMEEELFHNQYAFTMFWYPRYRVIALINMSGFINVLNLSAHRLVYLHPWDWGILTTWSFPHKLCGYFGEICLLILAIPWICVFRGWAQTPSLCRHYHKWYLVNSWVETLTWQYRKSSADSRHLSWENTHIQPFWGTHKSWP